MKKDIVGNIKPHTCFNYWRFKKSKDTYQLVNTVDIEIPKKQLAITYKDGLFNMNTANIFLNDVGAEVEDKLEKEKYLKDIDAWVISSIQEKSSTHLIVHVDLFKKDKWYNKLYYIFFSTVRVVKK